MEIIQITGNYYPQLGGVATVVKEISERLAKKGHNCTVITINPGNEKSEEVINLISVIRLNQNHDNLFFGFNSSFYSLVNNTDLIQKADIIHIHNYHTLFSAETVFTCNYKKINGSLIFSPQYHQVGHNWLNNLFLKLYKPLGGLSFKNTDNIICMSEYEANLVKQDFGSSIKPIHVIPLGVDKIDAKKADNYNKRKIRLLYVGNIIEYKGIQFIIKAMKILVEKCDDNAELTIVGQGNYQPELKKLSNELGLENNIFWEKDLSKESLESLYKKSDIFLLLSRAESYGIVVAEALAFGTPSIVSNTTALQEFIKEPGCFAIDYPPDVFDLANLIHNIHNTTVSVGPFSMKIRNWDEVANDYESVYLDAIKK